MARGQQNIYNSIVTNYVYVASLVGIVLNPAAFGTAAQWALAVNPPFQSMYNLQGLIMWTIAGLADKSEQLYDAFTADNEAIVKVSSPQTGPWLQNQFLNVFQASQTDPQVVVIKPQEATLSDGTIVTFYAPSYAKENDNYKVIKYCTATSGVFGNCLIKVAAQLSGLPVDLDTGTFAGCLDEAQSFANTIAVPGINYIVSSGASDKLFMQLDVYYKGQYASGIQGTVIAAITAYMAAIPFDGVLVISDIEVAIKAVPGVTNVVFNNIQARSDSTAVGTGTNLVLSNAVISQGTWATVAGYIIPENTTGANWTLTDYRAGSSGPKNLNLIPSTT